MRKKFIFIQVNSIVNWLTCIANAGPGLQLTGPYQVFPATLTLFQLWGRLCPPYTYLFPHHLLKDTGTLAMEAFGIATISCCSPANVAGIIILLTLIAIIFLSKPADLT
jgi:hypothetical protein